MQFFANVRYWRKADIDLRGLNVSFGNLDVHQPSANPGTALWGKASNEGRAISRWLSGAATYAATHCVLVGSLSLFHDQPLWFAVGDTFAGG